MIKRYCLTTETHEGPNSYIISRPSILGNPYSHLPEDKCLAIYRCKTRDEAIDAYSRSIGMKFGIGYITLEDGEYKGPIAKFLTEEQKAELTEDEFLHAIFAYLNTLQDISAQFINKMCDTLEKE